MRSYSFRESSWFNSQLRSKTYQVLVHGVEDGVFSKELRSLIGNIQIVNASKPQLEVRICKVIIYFFKTVQNHQMIIFTLISNHVILGVTTTNVNLVSRDICARPNTFFLEICSIERSVSERYYRRAAK